MKTKHFLKRIQRMRSKSVLLIPVILFLFSVIMISFSKQSVELPFNDIEYITEMENDTWERDDPVLPYGHVVDVIMILPFISQDPMFTSRASKSLEWILLWGTAEMKFHIVTDPNSETTVDLIMSIVNLTSNCKFSYKVYDMSWLQDRMRVIAMDLANEEEPVASNIVDHLTLLLTPFIFTDLNTAIYVDTFLEFRTSIVRLYNTIKSFSEDELLAVAEEQSDRFQDSLTSFKREHTSVRIDHENGFNSQLILMDMEKMRRSKAFYDSLRFSSLLSLVQKYSFNLEYEFIGSEEWMSIMSMEKPSWIHVLPCEWNTPLKGSHCEAETKVMNLKPEEIEDS